MTLSHGPLSEYVREREGKETKAGFVCLCIPLSCQPAAANLGTASALSAHPAAQLH